MTTTLTTLTVDSNSDNFWVGTIVTTLTSTSVPATATGGIVTDTSSAPPRRTTMTAATTTASSAAASSTPTSSSSGPSTGQLIGIIVGSVAGGCLLICIIFWFCWRRKRKLAARRRTKARINSPKRITRQSFQIPGSSTHSERTITDQQVAWPRPVNPDDIGVALTPSGNESFIKRLTHPRPRTRSFLPISAPIFEDRESGPSSFRDRFFAQPQSASRSEHLTTKHSSDATTIRTSCTLPTPDRPSIAVLRPWSTATSANTTFEEDMEFQPVDVPPVPTFTAVEVPLRAMNPGRKQGKPARLDLEAGIRKNFNKAISHVPMTPRYDNGYNRESSRKPSVPTIPTSKLRSSKSVDRSTPNTSSNQHNMVTPTRKYSATPVRATPNSQFLEIPNRESSFKHFMDNGDEEWLLRPSNKTTPQSAATTATRPALSVRRSKESSTQSPIRNLSYPKIPISASESRLANRGSTLQASSSKKASQVSAASSADDIARYSNRPLPRITTTDHDDPFVGPSNTARLFHTPLRLHVPPTPIQGKPDQQSRPSATSPRATFTPNRTNTGDLVLTVDM